MVEQVAVGDAILVRVGEIIPIEGVIASAGALIDEAHGGADPGFAGGRANLLCDGVLPRLAGQLHDYILRKLVNWSKERGQDPANPDTSAIMEPIAHGLTEPQIKAVAAYLSYLE